MVMQYRRHLTVYGLAILITFATLFLRQALSDTFGGRPLLILFMFPIIISALLGGLGPGLMATLVAAACSKYFIFPPVGSFAFANQHDLIQWSMLILIGGLVSVMSESLHHSRKREFSRWEQLAAIQNALTQSETLFQSTFELAALGIALISPNGDWLQVNRKLCEIVGYSREELLELTFQDITFPDDLQMDLDYVKQLLNGECQSYTLEKRYIRKDKTLIWINLTVTLVRNPDLTPSYFISIIEDIDARKQTEAALKNSEAVLEQRVLERTAELTAANRELDSFAYAVSHDLRAPLRAMSGFSQALTEDYGDLLQGEARIYLDQIDIASKKMGDLIDGLLVLSRCTRGKLQNDEVDLSALSERLLKEMAHAEPERHVETKVDQGLIVHGDSRMMEVVMRNLLSNAWKYTSGNTVAKIAVYSEPLEDIDYVCVADNGAGFNMTHSNRLFQPFQRLHRQDEFPGIGIGLATVQRIIHRHGGKIEARSEPHQGAKFYFNLSPLPEKYTNNEATP